MLIDEIKKGNIEAMKAHDSNARAALSIVMSRYTALQTSGSGKEVGDADVVRIIQKLTKELEEEKAGYLKANRPESAAAIDAQAATIAKYLPKMLGEEEIKSIIAGLEDKSIPSVMKHFKTNYDGQVDMGLVSRLARGL